MTMLILAVMFSITLFVIGVLITVLSFAAISVAVMAVIAFPIYIVVKIIEAIMNRMNKQSYNRSKQSSGNSDNLHSSCCSCGNDNIVTITFNAFRKGKEKLISSKWIERMIKGSYNDVVALNLYPNLSYRVPKDMLQSFRSYHKVPRGYVTYFA